MSNRLNDVVSTVSHALLSFEDMVKGQLSPIEVVYDEQLSFDTAIRSYLQKNNYNENPSIEVPFICYNRTIMRTPQFGAAQRMNNVKGYYNGQSSGAYYAAAYGEFDIQMLFISKSIESQEKFEALYYAEEGIAKEKEISVDMGSQLGDFKYFLSYEDLMDKVINYEGAHYKTMLGQITVRGVFFVFDGPAKIINEIRANVFSTNLFNEKQELVAEIKL